jgi:hypothetical protein
MGYAVLFPHEYQKRERKNVLAAKTFSEALLSQARPVRRETPELAIKVRDGLEARLRCRRPMIRAVCGPGTA